MELTKFMENCKMCAYKDRDYCYYFMRNHKDIEQPCNKIRVAEDDFDPANPDGFSVKHTKDVEEVSKMTKYSSNLVFISGTNRKVDRVIYTDGNSYYIKLYGQLVEIRRDIYGFGGYWRTLVSFR